MRIKYKLLGESEKENDKKKKKNVKLEGERKRKKVKNMYKTKCYDFESKTVLNFKGKEES